MKMMNNRPIQYIKKQNNERKKKNLRKRVYLIKQHKSQ